MTDDLIQRLMAAGLSKQQANSVTAKTLVNLFMDEDAKILIHEAKQQVIEMQELVNNPQSEYYDILNKINNISDSITAVSKAQDEHGTILEDKAKNLVALYSALLSMNIKAGASGAESVENAGYVTYAYLGGQAKRDVKYDSIENNRL